jgi:sugar diacid utilization regulator
MDISLNIILDSINSYRQELYVDLPSDKAFSRVKLLPRDLSQALSADSLYVCRLSEVLRMAGNESGIYYVCLRDRIRDDKETPDKLSGTIIINENLEIDQLFSEIQSIFITINNWYQEMQDAIITQKSIQDIITMSEPIIGNFITVSDTALSLIAYTKRITTDDPLQSALVENGYHTEEAIKLFKKLKRFDVWMSTEGLIINTEGSLTKYPCISKVFTFNETYFTHVVMICDHRPMTPGVIDLYNHLIHILTHFIKRNWEAAKNYDHVYTSLIVDLMQGKVGDRQTVNERARIVGIKPGDQYVVMLLTGGNNIDTLFPGLMALDIAKMFPRIRSVYYNCRLMLFLHHPDVLSYIKEQDIENQLNIYFEKSSVFCGISEVFDDLLELPVAYREAEYALSESDSNYQKGKVIWEGAPKWSNIIQFEKHYASCLLDKSEKNEELWMGSKYGKILLELLQTDIDKGTNNLEILYKYLVNERRASEASVDLHMHRNNVVYRINKIEEMLKINLNDTVTRLNLLTSFLMLKCSDYVRKSNNLRRII